jgi:putative ABC transport system permease protein
MIDDLRLAFRALRASPLDSALILATLGGGIGAAAAVFTLVDGLLLRPLPYGEAERLVAVFRVERDGTEPRNPTSPADYLDWKAVESFDAMTAARVWTPTLTGAGPAERLQAILATPELFDVVGVAPRLGRVFRTDADARTVVLGHTLWQRRFGGDPDIVGRTLLLNDQPHVVTAVMPEGFRFPPFWASEAELWAPLIFTPADAANRGASYLRVFGRLAPGVPVSDAQAAATVLAARLARDHPATNAGVGIRVEPLREPAVAGSRSGLLAMAAAVVLLLCIACANAAGIMLVRALGRSREMALRIALGAGPTRLARIWLAEALLLAIGAGVVGTLLASGAMRGISSMSASVLPYFRPLVIDWRSIAFATLLSLAAGIAAALAPVLHAARHDVADILRGGARTAPDRSFQGALVTGELVLATVLVCVAALIGDGFLRLNRADPGFRAAGVVAADFAFASERHRSVAAQRALFDAVLLEASTIPGADAAGLINHLPVAGDFWRSPFAVEGRASAAGPPPTTSYRVATGGYFDALGAPVLRGRTFDTRDGAESTGVTIVNETFARRAFGSTDIIGQRIRLGGARDADEWLEIIGVVGDVVQEDIALPVTPEVYLPYTQNPAPWFSAATLVVRGDGRVRLETQVREAIGRADPTLPVMAVRPLQTVLSAGLADRRFGLLVIGAFAAAALLITLIGVYAIIAQVARLRRRDVALRIALGANRMQVLRVLLGPGARHVALGLLLGLALAIPASIAAERALGIAAHRWTALAAAIVLLAGAALAAGAGPALRVSRTRPAEVLRQD